MAVSPLRSTADIRYRDHAGPDSSRNEVVMFLDFRVFIMGVEVTDYVKDSISFTRSLNGSENTLSFTLDNAFDRFVMTAENFKNYRDSDAALKEYSFDQSSNPERLSKTGLKFNNLAEFDPSRMHWIGVAGRTDVDELAKKQLFEYKIRHILEFNQANAHNATASTGTNTDKLTDKLPLYKLTVGCGVINLHDEVRVFMADPNHDPANPNNYKRSSAATNVEKAQNIDYRWMPVFSGFVSSAPIQRNVMDGSSTISVACADIRYMLRKMRVAGNIQSTNQTQTYIRFDDAVGVFQDAAFLASAGDGNVKFENLASALSYRQLTRALLCGDNPSDVAAIDERNRNSYRTPNNMVRGVALGGVGSTVSNPWYDKLYGATVPVHRADKVVQLRGVGNLSIGFEISNIRPGDGSWEQCVQAMEAWQDLLVFGAKLDWYTDTEVSAIGAGTKPVEFSTARGVTTSSMSPFSIMNGFVHYLFPGDASQTGDELGIRNLIERALINPQTDTSWTNRLDLLMQATETIDYKIQVNGMGDICFEYPMYDFTPNFYGKYAECFAVHDSLKSEDINDEGDGNVVTCLQVSGSYRDIEKSSGDAKSERVVADQQYSVFIKSDFMAAKYGIVVEEYPIPWSLDVWPLSSTDTTGNSVNTDAINKNTLISFGVIEMFKRIAAMSSMSVDIAFNPYVFPNRPLLNKHARRIGLTDNVSVSLQIDGAPTVQVDTKWLRHASQSDTEAVNGASYQTITGYMNTPFWYYADGLKLFTDQQLDGIRTNYGIEIIDPKTNKIDDITKSSVQFGGGFNSAVFTPDQAQNTVVTSNGNFSVSGNVRAAYTRYDQLATTDPDTYAAVNRIAGAAGAEPRDMYVLMEHESGGRDHIDPQGRFVYKDNPGKLGAQGIIQFMPDTLRGLKGRNGQPVDPRTFLKDYPTVVDQSDLAVQYYTRMRRQFGPLDTPYKLIMATVNPASIRDNMFDDFAQSNNKWTRDHAAQIKSVNKVKSPADFCLAKGYNYYNDADNEMQTGTRANGTPRMTKFYSTNPQAAVPEQPLPTSPALSTLSELRREMANSAPSNSTSTVPVPRTKAL